MTVPGKFCPPGHTLSIKQAACALCTGASSYLFNSKVLIFGAGPNVGQKRLVFDFWRKKKQFATEQG